MGVRCDVFGWHMPGVVWEVAGSNVKSRCARCNRPVMQDSQGNWFTYGNLEDA